MSYMCLYCISLCVLCVLLLSLWGGSLLSRGESYLTLFTVFDSNANVIDLIKTFDD